MSNKSWDKINILDKKLRQAFPDGPKQKHGTLVTIELLHGFEIFNTRPYHNYESWSKGYRISGFDISVEEEDLDDAIDKFIDKYSAKDRGGE